MRYLHLGAISSLVSMHTLPVSRAMRSKTPEIRSRASTRCASASWSNRNFIACLLFTLRRFERQRQFAFFSRRFLAHAALRRECFAAHLAQWCFVFSGRAQVRHLPLRACASAHFCCRVMGYLLRHTCKLRSAISVRAAFRTALERLSRHVASWDSLALAYRGESWQIT